MHHQQAPPTRGQASTARSLRRSQRGVMIVLMFAASIAVGMRLRLFSPFIRSVGTSIQLRATGPRPGGIKFIFFMGLEGSGHHQVGSRLRQSESAYLIDQWGLRGRVRDLQDALYSNVGLFYQHCNQTGYRSEILVDSPGFPSENTYSALDKLGPNETFHRVVHLFRTIVDSIPDGGAINIPLNADGYIANQASYPQDNDACRLRKYPDVALLYEACQEAGVECRHVYLTASVETLLDSALPKPPPMKTAKATIAPWFQKPLAVIYLYTTLLDVQLAQIAFFPHQTAACLDVSSDEDERDRFDAAVRSQSWQHAIDQIFGLPVNATSGVADLPPPANSGGSQRGDGSTMLKESEREFIVQTESNDESLYLKSLRTSHERTLRFCQATLRTLN